jgi:natural product biosynthesis luciferase-like monooxygenase protein
VTRTEHAKESLHPLSPIQHGMLYHYLADRHSDLDLVQVVCELRERLDVDRLRSAWNRVAPRHQAFRTRFHWDGVEAPVQEIVQEVELEFQVVDWTDREPHARDEAFRELLAEDRRHQFDIAAAPAMRFTLVQWSDAEWRLLWSLHHLLMDGRSFPIILCEVFDLYDRRRAVEDLPPAPQYSAFLDWLPGRNRAGDERHWRELLDGVTSSTPLPGGEGTPPGRDGSRREQIVQLTADETAAVAAFAASIGVTFNTVVQGAWALLLARHAGVDDVVFGATRVCREGTVPDADGIVGLFINTVPVRVTMRPDTPVRDLLGEVRQQHLAVRSHEHTALADIERWSGFGAGHRLFESIVVFDRTSLDGWMRTERPTWTHRTFTLRDRTPFPLTLYGYAVDELILRLASDRDRISDETADLVLGHFLTLLREIPKDPARAVKDIPMLSDAERDRQLVTWNATERLVEPNPCVHELVEAQVDRTADRDAVTDGITTLTYRELDERANRLAHRLRTLGVGPDQRVGVCVGRSVHLVVAVLGVLKAGGAYVPLDPDYPTERLEYMARDAGLAALVTADGAASGVAMPGCPTVDLTSDAATLARGPAERAAVDVNAGHLAYVIYTSGSTGLPKGVMVEHRNVANFFAAMDGRLPQRAAGTWLAVTSLSFDISVLELLWPLTRGFKVVVGSPVSDRLTRPTRAHGPEFSLFYFASGDEGRQEDKYRLLMDGARFADDRGFHAVWTPERHFHAFGGLYPNPSVAAAALAGITRRVQLRAGSVVLPLHHPIRVAEEWALVDNLSGGRVGVSFASGWQPNDFVLAPDHYADRKRVMLDGIDLVRRLWRGEAASFPGPDGKPVEVRILPRPLQAELPVWITTAGSAETYRAAGTAGANVLTHLLGQSVDDVAAMIVVYRDAWREAGHSGSGSVTLMLHTFVGADESTVRETVRAPMKRYLRSSVSLIKGFAGAWTANRGSAGHPQLAGDEFDKLSPDDMDSLLDFAFERYFETSGLFGSPARCVELVERLRDAGVDEIACLIDFGVPTDEVLSHLDDLDAVRVSATRRTSTAPALPTLIRDQGVTHLQCTPSLARMLVADPDMRSMLPGLQVMLVGGEPLPASLAAELRQSVGGPVINMYGPTETTVWSSVHEVGDEQHGTVPIGRPIANTRFYVLDHHGQPAPVGVPGELYVGGSGVVRGYLNRPELTDERFVPNPFIRGSERLYRTGDIVRWRADGVVEFLGRADHQVKIRGHRIELGEIEAVLASHPEVGQVVVNPWHRGEGDVVLVAYVVPANGRQPSDVALRAHADARLPEVMVPSLVVPLAALPLTPNGKVDRKALPMPLGSEAPTDNGPIDEAPPTVLEELVADVWRRVLGVAQLGPRDHFFRLGGNSLTTIQVAMGIRESLGIDLPLRAIFESPTVAELASHLEHRLLEGADTSALENLLTELEQPATGGQRVAVT